MQRNSFNALLSGLAVGAYHYVETTVARYAQVQRAASARSRWPAHMQAWRFTTAVYRAVGTALDDVRILVRIERIE